jgi:hypothetical protein
VARALLLLLLLLISVPARAEITLYTMGPGDELFSTFGHAAICVERRCYNYGTADFATPIPLTWSFVRGRARFWVSVLDEARMLAYYRSEDRAVFRQRLQLTPADEARLATALEASTDERVKYYQYHHFNDNCTTRIRDLIDIATNRSLFREPQPRGRSFRQWAREGFAGNWPLLAAVELLLGRSSDRSTTPWDAMFLPSELRSEVAARLHSPAELIVPSTRKPLSASPHLGEIAFLLAGILLALLVRFRPGLIASGLFLGLIGTILWALFALSSFPELTRNENLLAYWPTDLALGFLPPRLRLRYLDARLAVLAVLIVGHLFFFVQPLAALALPLFPLYAARFLR